VEGVALALPGAIGEAVWVAVGVAVAVGTGVAIGVVVGLGLIQLTGQCTQIKVAV
jgi:hypothetical protein